MSFNFFINNIVYKYVCTLYINETAWDTGMVPFKTGYAAYITPNNKLKPCKQSLRHKSGGLMERVAALTGFAW